MKVSKDIQEYVQALKASKRLGGQVVFHKVIPEEPATWGEPLEAWPGTIEQMLRDPDMSLWNRLPVLCAFAQVWIRKPSHR
jgi:hypothetical protein